VASGSHGSTAEELRDKGVIRHFRLTTLRGTRGDWTPLELFVQGFRAWESVFRVLLTSEAFKCN
jgi:hypothetical protein